MPLLEYLGIALGVSIVLIVIFVLFSADRRGRAWAWLVRFFSDSETIFWARLQAVLGLIFTALMVFLQSDFAPVLHALGLGKWVPVAVMVNGILTEVLRRRRATDL